jgi:nitric oxide reductase NorQ protein
MRTAAHSSEDTSSYAPTAGSVRPAPTEEPYYVPIGQEVALFEAAHADGTAVMLKGPTGCGKTRFVEFMAYRLARPLVTVACHDDLSATDLTGRWLVRGGDTVWQDGALAVAARHGAICYLDEVVESRQDVVVVLHPLSDHRRLLPIEKHGEIVDAAPGFQLVVSYNPGYQHALKELKPSTRQRFITVDFDFPPPDVECEIVTHEGRVDEATARQLVDVAIRVRGAQHACARCRGEVDRSRDRPGDGLSIGARRPADRRPRRALRHRRSDTRNVLTVGSPRV